MLPARTALMDAQTCERIQSIAPALSPLANQLLPQQLDAIQSDNLNLAPEVALAIRDDTRRLYELLGESAPAGKLDASPRILVTHQPTFMPYPGVWGLFFLGVEIASHISAEANVVYLSLDCDDASDRRIRTAHYPSGWSRNGGLPLSAGYKSADFRNVPQMLANAPSTVCIANWCERLEGSMLRSAIRPGVVRRALDQWRPEQERLAGSSANASEFNELALLGFVLGRSLRAKPWVVRMSSILKAAPAEFDRLLNRESEIKAAAASGAADLRKVGVDLDVTAMTRGKLFWHVCERCGRRVDPEVRADHARRCCQSSGGQAGQGNPKVSVPRRLPRVLVEDLLAYATLRPTLSMTYAGSSAHVLVSQFTSDAMGVGVPVASLEVLTQKLYGPAAGMLGQNRQWAEMAYNRITGARDAMAYPSLNDHESVHLRWSNAHESEVSAATT